MQPSLSLEERLDQEAINLRKQAEGMPLSIRRDELLRKGRPDGYRRSRECVADFARPARSDIDSPAASAAGRETMQ